MKQSKEFYRSKGYSIGWSWVGYDSELRLHEFSQGNYKEGFKVVRCYESEVFDGSLELLIKHSRTR